MAVAQGLRYALRRYQHVADLQANHFAGIGYEWSLGELQRAAKLNRNLGNEKAAAARKVAEARVYTIAMRGDTEKRMTGIVNDANVPAATVAADGTAGATTFASKTPTLINRDVNAVLNAPFNATRETHRANTLLLPTSRLQYMRLDAARRRERYDHSQVYPRE